MHKKNGTVLVLMPMVTSSALLVKIVQDKEVGSFFLCFCLNSHVYVAAIFTCAYAYACACAYVYALVKTSL